MIKVGIIGQANELTGQLTGLLIHHPDAEVKAVICPELEGRRIDAVYKALCGDTDGTFCAATDAQLDVIFLCDNKMAGLIPPCDNQENRLRIIALCPIAGDTAELWIYGLPELNRKVLVHDTYRVACPSAHATGILPGLLPLAKNLLLNSGLRITLRGSLFNELAPGLASEVGTALQSLQASFSAPIQIEYDSAVRSPGLLATIETECNVSLDVLTNIYEEYYDDHNFTFLTRDVTQGDAAGTNKCLISLEKDGNTLKVNVATDSRIKGLIGTAVHNMNLLFGLHERVGLMLMPQYL